MIWGNSKLVESCVVIDGGLPLSVSSLIALIVSERLSATGELHKDGAFIFPCPL